MNNDNYTTLFLKLTREGTYGHMYSEVFPELYAVDNTYPEYDCVVTIVTHLMTEIMDFFGLRLTPKIKFIRSAKFKRSKNKTVYSNSIVQHPDSYVCNLKNVLALKAEFHRLKPIVNKPKQYLIFCSRSSKKARAGRNITKENEEEIVTYLKEYAEEQNLEFYFLTGEEPDGSKTSIAKQYELFTNAKIVVGPHGGAFSNLIFLDPEKKPKIIEFCPLPHKSFMTLFGGAIETFAEYHQLPYILPPELLNETSKYIMKRISVRMSHVDLNLLKSLL
jgi:capsular polysaccharide biosynthesis protein